MRVLVTYCYYETPQATVNMDFFVQAGMMPHEDVYFIIVVNGEKCSLSLNERDDLLIIRRPNVGFDFGAYRHALVAMSHQHRCRVEDLPFDYFIFLNSSAAGPFLPVYYPRERHWTHVFTDRLNDRIKLVGPSIVCLSACDMGGYGPKVEGYCFATDLCGLKICWQEKTIFMDQPTKQRAIVNGEYGLSRAILRAGFSIDCLLYKYQGLDWSDPKNWQQNNNAPPSRQGTYEGISIHPFEVVFHKWYWSHHPESLVAYEYFEKYRKWKLDQIHRKKG